MPEAQHVYALFDNLDDALAAYQEVQAGGCSTEHCSAILHEGHIDESKLALGERSSGSGAAKGALTAGTVGGILGGAVALGGGIIGLGPLALVLLGAGVLGAYGGLTGGIAGADVPEPHMRAIRDEVEAGKILIALQADDAELRAMCERTFAKHHGRQTKF